MLPSLVGKSGKGAKRLPVTKPGYLTKARQNHRCAHRHRLGGPRRLLRVGSHVRRVPSRLRTATKPLRLPARGRLSDPEHTQKRSPSPAEKKLETFIQQDSKLAHVGDSNESDGDGGIDLLNEHLRLQLSTDRTPTPAGKPLHPLSFSFRSLVVA